MTKGGDKRELEVISVVFSRAPSGRGVWPYAPTGKRTQASVVLWERITHSP